MLSDIVSVDYDSQPGSVIIKNDLGRMTIVDRNNIVLVEFGAPGEDLRNAKSIIRSSR